MIKKDQARLDLWQLAWENFRRDPLGSGPDTFEYTYRKYRTDEMIAHTKGPSTMQAHAHNAPLQLLSTVGILGALAVAWILASTRKAVHPAERAVRAGLVALGINLLFNATGIEVMALAAFLVGILGCNREDRPVRAVSAGLSCFALIIALTYAVVELKPGLAPILLPCEPEFTARLSESVADGLVRYPTRAGDILAWGESAARRLSLCRPGSAPAQNAAGAIYFYGAQVGAPDRARMARQKFSSALFLDPHDESAKFVLRQLDGIHNSR